MLWSYNPKETEVSLVWADPVSLTATQGISIDFSSSGYLDVSVPLVRHPYGLISKKILGFPIRKSPDQSVFSHSPKLIAAYYVLFMRQPFVEESQPLWLRQSMGS